MFCHMWTMTRLYVLSHVDYGKALCHMWTMTRLYVLSHVDYD